MSLSKSLSSLDKAVKVAVVSFGIKGTLSLLSSLSKMKLPPMSSLVDTARFALFVGTLSGGYNVLEAALSSLRNNRKNDPVPSVLAGGLVGVALLIDAKDRRQPIALYTCANALHLVFTVMVKKGYVPDVPGGTQSYYVLLTCLCACWTLFACGFYPNTFFDSYKNFLIDFGKVPWKKLEIYRSMYKCQQERIANGLPPSDEPPGQYEGFCPIIHPKHSCWGFWWHVWLRAFKKGMRFYLPIHMVGMVLGGFKRPLESAKRVLSGAFWSSAFLASYISIVHRVWCFGRRWMEREHKSHLPLGGFLSGFSVLFEHANRRPEMALWCVPQVWKSMWNCAKEHQLVTPVPQGEVLLFSLAMAFTMYFYKHQRSTIKPTYLKLLDLLWKYELFVEIRPSQFLRFWR